MACGPPLEQAEPAEASALAGQHYPETFGPTAALEPGGKERAGDVGRLEKTRGKREMGHLNTMISLDVSIFM